MISTNLAKISVLGVLAAMLSLAGVGCQSERHTSQAVTLRVTDKESGKPLPGATVTILRGSADVRNRSAGAAASSTAPSMDLKDLPHGTTDADGSVRVIVDSAYLATDWTAGVMTQVTASQAGGSQDRLTGTTRNVEVSKGEASETVPVKMTPATASEGDTLQVFVQSIGKPMFTAHGKGPG